MKIGEAHRTQSSPLISANTIGALMHPAPIVMPDRTQHEKKFIGAPCLVSIAYWRHYYWRTEHNKWTKLLGFRVHSHARGWGKCADNRRNKLFTFCRRTTEVQFSFSHLLLADRTKISKQVDRTFQCASSIFIPVA
jgi:hypothetical protein